MRKKENNYAYIDAQNLYMGVQRLGWQLDYAKFRVYLKEHYSVTHAYMFLGYIEGNADLYLELQQSGFEVWLKPVVADGRGRVKGNVDADLVLRAALQINEYDAAVIVSSDGDFHSLVKHLRSVGRLKGVLSPYTKTCSSLLKIAAQSRIAFLDRLRSKLEKVGESGQVRENEKAPH